MKTLVLFSCVLPLSLHPMEPERSSLKALKRRFFELQRKVITHKENNWKDVSEEEVLQLRDEFRTIHKTPKSGILNNVIQHEEETKIAEENTQDAPLVESIRNTNQTLQQECAAAIRECEIILSSLRY